MAGNGWIREGSGIGCGCTWGVHGDSRRSPSFGKTRQRGAKEGGKFLPLYVRRHWWTRLVVEQLRFCSYFPVVATFSNFNFIIIPLYNLLISSYVCNDEIRPDFWTWYEWNVNFNFLWTRKSTWKIENKMRERTMRFYCVLVHVVKRC